MPGHLVICNNQAASFGHALLSSANGVRMWRAPTRHAYQGKPCQRLFSHGFVSWLLYIHLDLFVYDISGSYFFSHARAIGVISMSFKKSHCWCPLIFRDRWITRIHVCGILTREVFVFLWWGAKENTHIPTALTDNHLSGMQMLNSPSILNCNLLQPSWAK